MFGVECFCCLSRMYVFIFVVKFEWLPVGKINAHSAYDMFLGKGT